MTECKDITLDLDKNITPTQLVEILAEKGLKPLFQHASAQHFGVRSSAAKFEDGIEEDLLGILKEYYTTLLSDPELAQNFSKIRVKLLDWISQRGVEVAEVKLKHIGQDRETDPSVAIFLPPKFPGPNVGLHNPFGTGKIEFTPTRKIAGKILPNGTQPPRNRLIVEDSKEEFEAKQRRIQLPGETLILNAAMHSSRVSTGAHRQPIYDFDTLGRSGIEYHQPIGTQNWTSSPTGIFVREIE